MAADGNQRVILYDAAPGEAVVYAAAYNDAQAKEQVARCIGRQGLKAKVRVATSHPASS